jgi:hypothetical protein
MNLIQSRGRNRFPNEAGFMETAYNTAFVNYYKND